MMAEERDAANGSAKQLRVHEGDPLFRAQPRFTIRFTILPPAVEQSRMGTVMAAKQW